MPNFKTDLNRGLVGQQTFAKLFAGLKATDGKRGDFLLEDGSKVEVKADFYSMNKTQNYFMERYSSVEVGSPGGVWQAAAHGADYYAYIYVQNLHVSVWYVPELLAHLSKLEPKLTPVNVKNAKWTTVGYKVARSLLNPILTYANGSISYADHDYSEYFSTIWRTR